MESDKRWHYEGYQAARAAVYRMSDDDLLQHIDGLWGRENLPEDYTRDDLLAEALEQTGKDWITDYGKQQKRTWEGYAKAIIKS